MGKFLIPDGPPLQPAPPPDARVAREEKISNDTRVEQALNQFLTAKQGALFDAPGAFYRTQGEDAIHTAPVATKNLNQLRNTLLDGLANDYQRRRLGTALDAQMQLTRDGMARHVAEQSLAWQRGVAQDRIALLAKEAAHHHNDTGLIDALGHAAATAARAHSRVGDGPPGGEAEDAAAATARSGVLAAAIQARLDRRDTAGAHALLTQVQDQLDPAHAAPLQGQIDTLQRLGAAKDYADGIASAALTASPEEIDAQHQAALQQAEADHADNPRQQALAQHFLNQAFDARRQELQQSERSPANAVDEWLNTASADGGPQRDLPPPAVLSELDDNALGDLVYRLDPNTARMVLLPYDLPMDGAVLQNSDDVPEGESTTSAAEPPKVPNGASIIPVNNAPGDTTAILQSNPERAQAPNDGVQHQPGGSRGRGGIAANTEPPSNDPEFRKALEAWKGRRVVLPGGSLVPDTTSPTGYLMSPFADLRDVAAAGRKARTKAFSKLLTQPDDVVNSLFKDLKAALDHGGIFDYQRRADSSDPSGFIQQRQFRNVSNFNVGLFAQQAGIPLFVILAISGGFARKYSRNYRSKEPYWLDPQTRQFIEEGYKAGQSGAFDTPEGLFIPNH